MSGPMIARSTVYGLVFWFLAAMVVHLAPQLFDGGMINLAGLAISIPASWLSIPISKAACGVDDRHVVDANVIAIIAATFADGIGISFFADALYAGPTAASARGAAWILWGVGWILLFAWRRRAA